MSTNTPGTSTSFGPLEQVDAGVLSVGYAETGPADGPAVLLLHGWPYDIHSYVEVAPLLAAARTANVIAALWPERCKAMVSVSGYLIGSPEANKQPLPPTAELRWWYQYYFATERGRAGYDRYRHDFARLIWQLASPRWDVDDATFDRSAASLDNPDHASIVIHNYRWRLGLAEGEPDANGAPHPDPASYAEKFTGKYTHRLIPGGVGHNLPQEAPKPSPRPSSRSTATGRLLKEQ